MACTFTPGDPVIYRITKHSDCPGPRAKAVSPSPNGDDYKYQVDKFWVVDKILDNGQLLIRTRRGKTRVINSDDLNLRTPRWWEYLLYRRQFPTQELPVQERNRETVSQPSK
ncbi:MAG TPA: hypothetical protein VNQ76_12170 [Planctomicrobium sp.]|nr:hypothetical protein [Planctomicrobium sp.]